MDETGLQGVVSRNIRVLMAVRAIEAQKDLAALLGWDQSKLTRSLRGDRKWSLDDLSELARAFGLEPRDLLGDVTHLVSLASAARTGTDAVTSSVTQR